jgi:hypothetical protein
MLDKDKAQLNQATQKVNSQPLHHGIMHDNYSILRHIYQRKVTPLHQDK